MILFIDLETSGLPKCPSYGNYYAYTDKEKYDSSRIVEICWIICDKKGNELKRQSYIVRPGNFEIPEAVSNIHGITQTAALLDGYDIDRVFSELNDDIIHFDTKKFVSHNVGFDYHVLMSELHRNRNFGTCAFIAEMKKKCTMEAGKNICKIKPRFGNGFKPPRLNELYDFLFDTICETKHRAESDTEMCVKCYFELVRRSKSSN